MILKEIRAIRGRVGSRGDGKSDRACYGSVLAASAPGTRLTPRPAPRGSEKLVSRSLSKRHIYNVLPDLLALFCQNARVAPRRASKAMSCPVAVPPGDVPDARRGSAAPRQAGASVAVTSTAFVPIRHRRRAASGTGGPREAQGGPGWAAASQCRRRPCGGPVAWLRPRHRAFCPHSKRSKAPMHAWPGPALGPP